MSNTFCCATGVCLQCSLVTSQHLKSGVYLAEESSWRLLGAMKAMIMSVGATTFYFLTLQLLRSLSSALAKS